MLKALLFAGIAAIGNAVFVFGQRRSDPSENPFVFMSGAVVVCSVIFIMAAFLARNQDEAAYIAGNFSNIIIGGVGFFITFVGFYLLYSRFGASLYVVYAVLSIITTAIGVGVIIFREPFNRFHFGGLIMAIMAIALFSYGQFGVK